MKNKQDRFRELNPRERTILRVLLQNHLNSVSEISMFGMDRERAMMGFYLGELEQLEHELLTT